MSSTPQLPSNEGINAPTQRGAERRQAVLDAAMRLFLAHGFSATSLDKIIEQAGGSRRTIYETFGSKEGLLQAVVTDSCQELLAHLDADAMMDMPPRQALTYIGELFLAALIDTRRAALFRLVVAESAQAPELGRLFMASGPHQSQKIVIDYLNSAIAAGDLLIENPAIAAAQFLEMVKAELYYRALFYGEIADKKTRRRYVDSAVNIFLAGTQSRN